jgi:predicted RNA-binding protein with TRAM domain
MEIADELLCVYTTQLTERDESYVLEVPEQEVELGSIQSDTTYRVALVSLEPTESHEPNEQDHVEQNQQPPVEEEEIREVEIEDIGDQGDGIARVERGYVVIVAEAEVGDRVTVRITEARKNVAFAEVVKQSES